MRRYMTVLGLLLLATWANTAEQADPGRELCERLRGTTWQWNGGRGEVVVFGDDGYVRHEGWTARGLVTRWEAVDRRTALLTIERGRPEDLHAVLTFAEDMASYGGFNFHGGTRIRTSRLLEEDRAARDTAASRLCVVWSSADPDVAKNVCFMYTLNAKKQGWFDVVHLVVWGPSAKLLAEDASIQAEVKAMREAGVVVEACVVCARRYKVDDDLRQLGLDVKGMGKPLSDRLKEGWKAITF